MFFQLYTAKGEKILSLIIFTNGVFLFEVFNK